MPNFISNTTQFEQLKKIAKENIKQDTNKPKRISQKAVIKEMDNIFNEVGGVESIIKPQKKFKIKQKSKSKKNI